MSRVTLRAYGRLNDFLAPPRRQRPFARDFRGRASVKDLIESAGIPHPEVALILANGEPVDFAYQVGDLDRLSVYPPLRSLDSARLPALRHETSGKPRFVLDTHLGRLARYLRLLGFDTLYQNDFDDAALERIAVEEDRVLLTQDVGLLKRAAIQHGYFVRASDPRLQLVEVAGEFDLLDSAAPFERCLRCNSLLEPVPKAEIEDRLMPRTRAEFDEFYRCDGCGAIYWKGSHYDRMRRLIEELERELRGRHSKVESTRRVPRE